MSLIEISDLKLCKKYANLYRLFYEHNVDPFDSILKLVRSEIQHDYDSKNMIAVSQSVLYDYERLESSETLLIYQYEYNASDILWFIGYILLTLSYAKGIKLAEFVTKNVLQYLWDNYEVLHSQSVEYTVDNLMSFVKRL